MHKMYEFKECFDIFDILWIYFKKFLKSVYSMQPFTNFDINWWKLPS